MDFLDEPTGEVVCADCLEHMRTMPDACVDAIITDPPYGLAFMGAKWDSFGSGPGGTESVDERKEAGARYADENKGAPRYGNSHGKPVKLDEMVGFQAAMTPIFEEALRVAKPGAYLLCFGGTRTFHRMACAIEDAGWEVRDTVMWVYGSGFPKSMDVAKAIDKAQGYVGEVIGERTVDVGMQGGHMHAGRKQQQQQQQVRALSPQAQEWAGWGTCLKPAWEPIIMARKRLDGTVANTALTWGTGAINIDACRVPTEDNLNGGAHSKNGGRSSLPGDTRTAAGMGMFAPGQRCKEEFVQPEGLFPANLAHDGSDEVVGLFPQSKGQLADRKAQAKSSVNCYGDYGTDSEFKKRGDEGSAARFFNTFRTGEESADRTYADKGATDFAAKPGMRREPTSADRFFYCAKASKKDRGEGNNHPTVKPQALMEWLVKMVTREDSLVLDPFAGSGTTLVACQTLGRDFIGIEREPKYCEIARNRLGVS